MTNAQLLEELGINLKNKSAGTHKLTCPKCSDTRKNKKDPCLSVNIDEGWYKCHHPDCNWSGKVYQGPTKIEKKEFVRPVERLEKLSKGLIDFFETKRKISNNTLLRFKITEGKEWMPKAQAVTSAICFNYYRNDQLVNIKFRGNNKDFKMEKDAELIFYNLDALKYETECAIVEGEIDCMSFHESGIYNSISVPNGASKGNQRLEYLDNCWDSFKNMKKIVLATDGDDAGIQLRDELARRLGYERCYRVSYPDGCKDTNEVLVKLGPDAVKKLYAEAEEWPMEGIIEVIDMIDDVIDFYENGYPNGYPVPIAGMYNKFQLMLGQMTTVTGIPGSGKSEFVDAIAVSMSETYDWRWGVLSLENHPASLHVTKLLQKYTKKSFAVRKNPEHRIARGELGRALDFINDHFFFMKIDECDISIPGIIAKLKELVLRKGIKGFIIDPWNKIRHPKQDLDYIRDALNQLIHAAQVNGIHLILVAHPYKMVKVKVAGGKEKYPVPTLYSISGSADFYNMTDNGLSIYRDFETGVVDVYRQKIRFDWLGEVGFSSYTYDKETRQYFSIDPVVSDMPLPFDTGEGMPF